MTNKHAPKYKCRVCGEEATFVAFNRLPYCGKRMDPNGCFRYDVTGEKGKQKNKSKKYSTRNRDGKSNNQSWIPSVLRAKTVHTSTVGVGK